ncbi:MAG: nitroreductase/quinone reductase family protein [Dehalococcoidia bacterium]
MNPEYLRDAEREFFRTLNRQMAPLVKHGLFSPGLSPSGLVLVEIVGRRTGIVHPVPLVATALGEVLLVATLRGDRSHWIPNLEATPDVRYWLRGRAIEGRAVVIRQGGREGSLPERPAYLGLVAAHLRAATSFGWSFALLTPRADGQA